MLIQDEISGGFWEFKIDNSAIQQAQHSGEKKVNIIYFKA